MSSPSSTPKRVRGDLRGSLRHCARKRTWLGSGTALDEAVSSLRRQALQRPDCLQTTVAGSLPTWTLRRATLSGVQLRLSIERTEAIVNVLLLVQIAMAAPAVRHGID